MSSISRRKWLIFRLVLLAYSAWGIPLTTKQGSNVDWPACFLIGTVFALTLFGWLTAIRSRRNVDWSAPYSWNEPFWPLAKYPLRFWVLAGYMLTLGGALSILEDVALNRGHMAVSGSFLFMGLFILAALKLWIRIFKPFSPDAQPPLGGDRPGGSNTSAAYPGSNIPPISRRGWLIFRLVVLLCSAWGLPAAARDWSNVNWTVCFLISAVFALVIFRLLTASRSRQNVDWSAPYSWYEPFWPLVRYPLRFWLLAAYALTLGGALSILENVALNRGHMAVSGTFLFMGLFMLAAVRLWIRIFRPT